MARGRRADRAAPARNKGRALLERQAWQARRSTAWLGPDDLIVNKQATTATLRFRGVDLTWTATGLVTTVTESSDVVKVTRSSGTTRTKFTERVLSNDAAVTGTVDGRAIDNTLMPETATISRLVDRNVTR